MFPFHLPTLARAEVGFFLSLIYPNPDQREVLE